MEKQCVSMQARLNNLKVGWYVYVLYVIQNDILAIIYFPVIQIMHCVIISAYCSLFSDLFVIYNMVALMSYRGCKITRFAVIVIDLHLSYRSSKGQLVTKKNK